MSIELEFTNFYEGVKNPFRWYLSSEKLNSCRRICRGECKYKLLTPADSLLPFQVYTTIEPPHTIDWNIYDEDGNLVWPVDSSMLKLVLVDGYYYYIYKGDPHGIILPNGFYTSRLTITKGMDSVTWYSEEFYVYNGCGDVIPFEQNWDFHPCLKPASVDLDGRVCVDASECQEDEYFIAQLTDITIENLTYYGIVIEVDKLTGTNPEIVVINGGGDELTITSTGTYNAKILSGFSSDFQIAVRGGTVACFTIKSIVKYEMLEQDCASILEWWQDCGVLGEIVYGNTGYKNKLILDPEVEVVDISPELSREGHENGENEIIYTFQKRTTRYTLDLAKQPPYIVEALFEMAMHEHIQLNLISNLGTDKIKNVTPRYNWSEGRGCYAITSLDYELDDNTVATNCCDADIDENPCIDSEIVSDDWTVGPGWTRCPCEDPDGPDDTWFCVVTGESTNVTSNSNTIASGKKYRATISYNGVIAGVPGGGIQVHVGGCTFLIEGASGDGASGTAVYECLASVSNELFYDRTDFEVEGCVSVALCEIAE